MKKKSLIITGTVLATSALALFNLKKIKNNKKVTPEIEIEEKQVTDSLKNS